MKKLLAAVAVAGLALASAASAQDFPNRSMTMIVPYPAGGVTDGLARLIAERMQAALGQNVIVENVGGAAGSVGAGRVARAAPDGYMFLFGNSETNIINGAALTLNYHVIDDFTPVAMMPAYPFLIVSKNAVPAKNLKEFVGWLKTNHSKVFQGTVGAGTVQQLCGVRMQEQLGVKWSFVPYRGGAPAMQDLLAGQFDFMCTASGSFLPLVRAGQIRGYAVTAKTRMEAAPDIPTVDEAGLPGLYVAVWNAIWAPKNTPKDIVAKLNAAAVKALSSDDVRKKVVAMGLDMPAKDQLTPEALEQRQKSEAGMWWATMKKMKESAAK